MTRISTVGGRLFGTILNRTPRRSGDVYGYGYGYGYGEPIDESPRRGFFRWTERSDRAERSAPSRRAVR